MTFSISKNPLDINSIPNHLIVMQGEVGALITDETQSPNSPKGLLTITPTSCHVVVVMHPKGAFLAHIDDYTDVASVITLIGQIVADKLKTRVLDLNWHIFVIGGLDDKKSPSYSQRKLIHKLFKEAFGNKEQTKMSQVYHQESNVSDNQRPQIEVIPSSEGYQIVGYLQKDKALSPEYLGPLEWGDFNKKQLNLQYPRLKQEFISMFYPKLSGRYGKDLVALQNKLDTTTIFNPQSLAQQTLQQMFTETSLSNASKFMSIFNDPLDKGEFNWPVLYPRIPLKSVIGMNKEEEKEYATARISEAVIAQGAMTYLQNISGWYTSLTSQVPTLTKQKRITDAWASLSELNAKKRYNQMWTLAVKENQKTEKNRELFPTTEPYLPLLCSLGTWASSIGLDLKSCEPKTVDPSKAPQTASYLNYIQTVLAIQEKQESEPSSSGPSSSGPSSSTSLPISKK